MTREEKIMIIAEKILEAIKSDRTSDEWIMQAIICGRIGLRDMNEKEIDIEYRFWVEDETV